MAELDEMTATLAGRGSLSTVIGGGPTGVEIAGQIAELSRRSPHGVAAGGSIRVRCVSSCSKGGRRSWPTSVTSFPGRQLTNSERIGLEIHTGGRTCRMSMPMASRSKRPTARFSALRRRRKYEAAGVAASPLATALARSFRLGVRSSRAHQGATRLFAARLPRGVRQSAT